MNKPMLWYDLFSHHPILMHGYSKGPNKKAVCIINKIKVGGSREPHTQHHAAARTEEKGALHYLTTRQQRFL